ncbi:MAG: SUMF1/EgtB/PvdO family nonheme iron enzyme [Myxococcota bacterium]|nr:SUMF1/EgtB/PvdO family nonheme iron enzyme [Myxococcota bacterium]
MSIPTYTKHERAVLWLVRGDEFSAGPEGAVFEYEVGSFYISKHVITNLQFESFRPGYVRSQTSLGADDPAVGVSFLDALAYCRWYSEVSQKHFRLPTEMEWEYACAYGSRKRYPWGNDSSGAAASAWTRENAEGHCQPVGLLEANKPGLHDMLGNVWEWTSSMDLGFPAQEEDGRDDLEQAAPRVIRGGGFQDSVGDLSCWVRQVVSQEESRGDLGFRIVRAL